MQRAASEAADRAAVYRLLSVAYLAEADPAMMELFGRHPAFAAGEHGGAQPPELAARLRPEYARIFVLNILPYESLYVDSDDPMLDSDSTQMVVSAYKAAGFVPLARYNPGAPDHVGLELACLAELNQREAAALRQGANEVGAPASGGLSPPLGGLEVAPMLAALQRSFLQNHLAAWVAPFTLAVERVAREPWYRALARFTAEFVLGDLDRLAFAAWKAVGPPLAEQSAKAPPLPLLPTHYCLLPRPGLLLAEQSLRTVAHTLTMPALCGFQLSREDLTGIAAKLKLPAGFAARERLLMNLFESSARYGVLVELLKMLGEIAREAGSRYHAWSIEFPCAATVLQAWESRAAATVRELQTMQELARTAG